MFSGCTVLPNSKQTKLGSSSQEASPSAGKNTRVVLVSCSRMEVHPYSFSGSVDISEVHGCVLSEGCKNYHEAGLFRSNTNFIIVIAQITKIIKLSDLYLYDIQTGHI